MNIIEAVKQMQPKAGQNVGCKMTRVGWDVGTYIRIEYGAIQKYEAEYHESFDWSPCIASWSPCIASLLSEDWVKVVE